MHRRVLVAGAMAVAVTAALLSGSGRGSAAAAVRGARQIPVGLEDAIHARFGAEPHRSAARATDPPEFGIRVALSADGTTALVGAPGVTSGSGAVYVYHVDGSGSWTSRSTPTATLKNADAGWAARFGATIALSADGTTAFVGAPFHSLGAGGVYVFHVPSEDAWVSTPTPTASLTITHGAFIGGAIAVSPDGTTLVMGDPAYNSDLGGAYIFHVSSEDAWVSSSTPTATLSNAAETSGDVGVGGVVAISGDGTTALLSDSGTGTGGAYVFHVASESGWATSSAPTAILTNAASFPFDYLGASLAFSGDGTTAFLGAPGRYGETGAVEVFHAAGEDSWASSSTPAAILTTAGGTTLDELGGFVRVADSGTTVVASAPGVARRRGAAYVFHVSDEGAWTSTDTPTAALTNSAGRLNDRLGWGMAIAADGATVLAGAPEVEWATGAVDVFHVADASSWLTSATPTATLTNSTLRACVVPKLRGKTVPAARSALAARRCRLGKVRRVHAKGKKGHVVSQSVRSGSRWPVGTKVAVKVVR